jgi:hypothetical protein
MTCRAEIRRPVDQWVTDHPGKECRGAERQALLDHLKIHFPTKTPQQLKNKLNAQIGKTHGVIAPERTPKAYKPRAFGAPTGASKEVQDVKNAIRNPINNPINNPIFSAARKRKREEEAKAMLAEKGYADLMLSDLEVEELVDEIISKPMPEFDNSILNLLDKTQKKGLDFACT